MSTIETPIPQATFPEPVIETPAAQATFSENISATLNTVSETVGGFFKSLSESSPVQYVRSIGEHQYVQTITSYVPHAVGGAGGFIAAQSAVDLVNDYRKETIEGEDKKINTRSLLKFGASSVITALAYTQTEQKADVLSAILAGIATGSFIKAIQKNKSTSPDFTLEQVKM